MMVSVYNAMLDSNRDGHAKSHCRLSLRANEKGGEEDSGSGGIRPITPPSNRQLGMGPDDGPPSQARSASLPPMRPRLRAPNGAQFGRVPPQSLL